MTTSTTPHAEPPVFRVLRQVGSAFLLAFGWIVGCLPLVTAPAATVALFSTVERWRRQEATNGWTFVADARRAGAPAYRLGAVQLLATTVLAADLIVAAARPDSTALVLGMTSVVGLVVSAVLTQAWAGVARSVVVGTPHPGAGLTPAMRTVIRRPLAALGATAIWLAAGAVLLTVPHSVLLVTVLALPAGAAWCALSVAGDETRAPLEASSGPPPHGHARTPDRTRQQPPHTTREIDAHDTIPHLEEAADACHRAHVPGRPRGSRALGLRRR